MIVLTLRPYFWARPLILALCAGRALQAFCRIGAGRTGDEDQVGMLRRIVEAGGGRRSVHQERAPLSGLRRQEGALRLPELSREGEFLVFGPEPLHDGGELVGHHVAEIVLDRLQPEHAVFARLVAGDDVDAPASATDVVHGCAELCEMQRMPCVKDVDGIDQHDRSGQRGERCIGDDRIDLVLAKVHLAAVAAFAEPLREAEYQVEAECFGRRCTASDVVERP